VKVNHKWRASKAQVQGFPIHTKTGKWLSQKEVDDLNADPNTAGLSARVNLFSYSTANALYIEPCAKLNLSPDGIKTLMYALKRAVELHFQIEPREIAATIMGDREQPNIFLYEATEGSLGVLSQIGLDVAMFKEIVLAAYHLCHFRDGKDTHKDGELCAASYADLLDYYNQRDHSIINRHLIKGALELMRGSNFDNSPGSGTLEEQYQKLRIETDPKSELERKLLDYLFSNSLRLPDMAQVNMSKYGCYTSADFIFEKERIAIFVDGSVHDPAPIVAEDDSKRECLERLGWEVLIWHYQQSVESFVQQYPHIFTKARI
jgi:very-short-patch-repair endonuclease